ncbi:hypothetical protein DIPPA_50943 [Diplonema papillatum]|nr:hypothetical protein DIPPA_50943 [Diplonema papillatum]
MFRAGRVLLNVTNNRLADVQVLKTGGVPRVNESPQSITYRRKRLDWVHSNEIIKRRQRQWLSDSWTTLPVLQPLVSDGVQLYQRTHTDEVGVALVRDKVYAKRKMKERLAATEER